VSAPALPRLLTQAEVCALLGISRFAVYEWVRDGKMPAPVVLGTRTQRWPEEEIARFRAELLAARKPRS
jgi:excisionase family DNA binding protein